MTHPQRPGIPGNRWSWPAPRREGAALAHREGSTWTRTYRLTADQAVAVSSVPTFFMPCSRVSSGDVVLGPVTALQCGSSVRGSLARSGEIWGRWYLVGPGSCRTSPSMGFNRGIPGHRRHDDSGRPSPRRVTVPDVTTERCAQSDSARLGLGIVSRLWSDVLRPIFRDTCHTALGVRQGIFLVSQMRSVL